MKLSEKIKRHFNHVTLAHTPTPLEQMKNLSQACRPQAGEVTLWVKRDDCTGLAAGGNKARQLEFYLGEAIKQGADVVLTTGATQSNHVRMTVAAARKLGMDCEVQLEERVADRPKEYYDSGNPFLIRMMGAKIHTHPVGEDEEGADRVLYERAKHLSKKGKKPFVIPLSPNHLPVAALGYVLAAEELLAQAQSQSISIDAIVVATGSAMTYSGLLTGIKALGSDAKVYGICVRRNEEQQRPRVAKHCQRLGEMIGQPDVVRNQDILISDATLEPGYGQLNPEVSRAISAAAETEGLLLDPTYTGKAMAGMLHLVEQGEFAAGQNVVFIHTGGLPGVFGYPELVQNH